jgi:hypothetical protein
MLMETILVLQFSFTSAARTNLPNHPLQMAQSVNDLWHRVGLDYLLVDAGWMAANAC